LLKGGTAYENLVNKKIGIFGKVKTLTSVEFKFLHYMTNLAVNM
jgi:hypothetical protein